MHKITKILNKEELRKLNKQFNNKYHIQLTKYPLGDLGEPLEVEYPVYYMDNHFYLHKEYVYGYTALSIPLYENIKDREEKIKTYKKEMQDIYGEKIEDNDADLQNLDTMLLLSNNEEKIKVPKEGHILMNNLTKARYF